MDEAGAEEEEEEPSPNTSTSESTTREKSHYWLSVVNWRCSVLSMSTNRTIMLRRGDVKLLLLGISGRAPSECFTE